MPVLIALLRGINVGKNNSLPMPVLISALESLGATDVQTYIRSGNAVFRRDADAQLARRLSEEIGKRCGFEPHILILGLDEWEDAMRANPFPEAESDPKNLHVSFLDSAPEHPDLKKLEAMKSGSERFHLKGKYFYLHAPQGIGRSKLAAAVEKVLGVPATDRNWRTVSKLRDLARNS